MRLSIRDTVFATASARPLVAFAASVAAILAIQAPAYAQNGAAASAPQPEGIIIYSRDVSTRSAIGPEVAGRPHSVVTGPTNLILSSIAAGLVPIDDDETAGITAGTNPQGSMVGDHVAIGLGALSHSGAQGDAASNLGDIQSTATGGAISQASGAISNAMGVLRGVLGGGQ